MVKVKKILEDKIHRRKSPTVAPGTHCPIPKDVTFKSVTLALASERDSSVTIPGLDLKAKVRALYNMDHIYSYELLVSGVAIRLSLQGCMTWGVPLIEKYKLDLIKQDPVPPKTKSKN